MRNHVVMVEEFFLFSHIQGCLKILSHDLQPEGLFSSATGISLGLTAALPLMRKIRFPFAQLYSRVCNMLENFSRSQSKRKVNKAPFARITAYPAPRAATCYVNFGVRLFSSKWWWKFEPEVKSINVIYYSIWSIFPPCSQVKKSFQLKQLRLKNKSNKINVLFGSAPSKNRVWLSSSC